MQLHQIKPISRSRKARRVGRGGKRGTFSGRGSKGQQARGARLGPNFRGGNRPLWKVFPKRRGSSKKTEKKRRYFQLKKEKPAVVNLEKINQIFIEGEIVTPNTLAQKRIVAEVGKIKILGTGELTKKLKFSGLLYSQTARAKIIKVGEIMN